MQTLSRNRNLDDAITCALHKVNSVDLKGLEQFFTNLPADPYLKGDYRFRRLSRFTVAAGSLVKLPHDYLYQSKKYNPLLGDVKREYSELEDGLIELGGFQKLFFSFIELCQLNPKGTEIAVHQIRTTCSPDNYGNPAPEGIHRDGVDFVGIFCVSRNNIEGGETHLYKTKKEPPVLNKILEPGEMLVVNDHKLSHFTTPIKPTASDLGTRDVFVFTFPGLYFPSK